MTIDRDREAFEAALRAHIAATGDDRAGPGFLAGWQAALTHAREAPAQKPVAVPADRLFMVDADHAVCFGPSGRFHGWLFRRHADGQFVSVRKLDVTAPYPAGHPLAALFGTPPAAPGSPPTDHSEDALDMVKTPRRERGWG